MNILVANGGKKEKRSQVYLASVTAGNPAKSKMILIHTQSKEDVGNR